MVVWAGLTIDAERFDRFYRANVGAVYGYLSRLTAGDRPRAEELTQAVFLRLVTRLSGGAELPETGWLIVTSRSVFIDGLRADERRTTREERSFHLAGAASGEPVWDEVAASTALTALQALSPPQRAALVFRYVDDLPVNEVATLLDRSVEATESLLMRAKRALANSLEPDCAR